MDAEKTELFKKRLNLLKEALNEHEADMFLVTKEENKNYLSMFYATSFYILIAKDKNYLITDFRYKEAASELKPLYDIVMTSSDYTLFDFLNGLGVKSIGLEFKTVTMDFYAALEEKLPEADILSFDGIIEQLRAVKNEVELKNIAEAEKIGDKAFSYILGEIKPGVTEKEIALKLEMKMRQLGAERLSFETICVSGVRASMPHGRPRDRGFEKGDFVTVDFGCVYNGYCSDMTRTVAIGSVSGEQRRVYNTVLAAQKAACAGIKAGMTGAEADAIAREYIAAEGYGEYFGHGMGHGVGLEIHEAPTANPKSKEILKKNMLLTIEPGIYIPKKFGVRIEDLSVITDSGIINLTKSDKELIII